MLRIEALAQPTDGRIVDLLHEAMADARYRRLDAAVAYATSSGVGTIRRGSATNLDRIHARWLSSFDWCRSDPVALSALNQSRRSEVRIFDGDSVVKRRGCLPSVSFHPKGFVFSGPGARLVISGSGNLSRNGLCIGTELNTVVEVRDPKSAVEKAAWNAIESVRKWHRSLWTSATSYGSLEADYQDAYKRAFTSPPPTDDDCTDIDLVHSARSYGPQDLAKIRRASVFWIEAGNLTHNLGPGNPGNQLMMRGLTRVFFGFDGRRVAKQTPIGTVDIWYDGITTTGLSLEFAHNSMDRLNLPRPGDPGPDHYDGETLVFDKVSTGGRILYELNLAGAAERQALRQRSKATGTAFEMPGGGRQFGFCAN